MAAPGFLLSLVETLGLQPSNSALTVLIVASLYPETPSVLSRGVEKQRWDFSFLVKFYSYEPKFGVTSLNRAS